MKRKYVALGIITIVLFVRVRPAKGQLGGIPGIPTIVFDPTSVGEIIKDVAAAIQLNNMVQTSMLFFDGGWKYRWRGLITQVIQTAAPNWYGETNGWYYALSTGSAPPMAWNNATMPLIPSPGVLQDPRQRAQLASVDIHDQAGVQALTAVGQSAADRKQIDAALDGWEQIVLDGSAGTNSQTQQLNLMTAGSAIQLHYAQLQDTKLSALLGLQLADAKRRRDEEASELQFITDVELASVSQGFGLGSCVSCTIGSIPQ